jgi:bifunctional DNA-binding transcriptional regulator/antitoxin component of YhaV-PrlF toxin-antitoxin module
MTQSTITDKFQTTIPLKVRVALKLRPRQRISYELRPDGSAILRAEPGLDELFGSLKPKRPIASSREEKQAARAAMAREAGGKGVV